MSAPATDASAVAPAATPSSGGASHTSSEPTATGTTGGEPTSTTASEPTTTAGEPASPSSEQAPSFPSADEYGWDDWDGSGTGLPEQVQGWFGKFNDRWNSASDKTKTEHMQALQEANSQGQQWQRMYEHLATGVGDDPRIAEFEAQVADFQTQLEAANNKYTTYETRVDAHMEQEAKTYIKWVQDQYPDLIKGLTTEGEARVYQLMGDDDSEGLAMHNALQVHAAGDNAYTEALTMLKDGVPENYIMQMIKGKYQAPAARSSTLAAPRSSAGVVAGAQPTQTAPVAREKKLAEMAPRERYLSVARKAMARDKR